MKVQTLFFAFTTFCVTTGAKPKLKRYNVLPRSLTVSGFSSGGAMCTQFHFIHSANVTGAGIFAGVPYTCAAANGFSLSACTHQPASVKVDRLVAQAKAYATNKQIDPTSNVAKSPVYIYHGQVDKTIDPGLGLKIQEMYQRFGVGAAKLKTEFGIRAPHEFPTYWKRKYAGAYEMLNHLYGGVLKAPKGKEGVPAGIVDYDQTEFFGVGVSPAMSTLAANAYLYVPSACKGGTVACRLHVTFHWCDGDQTSLAAAGINKYFGVSTTATGLADVAEVNNIILLLPQVNPGGTDPLQKEGCWDWTGYTNPATYPTRKGEQISAVYKMVNRVING